MAKRKKVLEHEPTPSSELDPNIFTPTDILSSDVSKPCGFAAGDEATVRSAFGFYEEVEFRIPSATQRADFVRPGWVVLYLYPFSLGLRFPFPSIARDFFVTYRLNPVQVFPYAWRILLSVNAILEEQGWYLRAANLVECYSLRRVTLGRFTFRIPEGEKSIIRGQTRGRDKDWLYKYVFVKISSVGPDVNYLFDTWHLAADKVIGVPSRGGRVVIDDILRLPVIERLFPDVLSLEGELSGDSGSSEDEVQVFTPPDTACSSSAVTISSGVASYKAFSISERICAAKRRRSEGASGSVSRDPLKTVLPPAPVQSPSSASATASPAGTAHPSPFQGRSDISASAGWLNEEVVVRLPRGFGAPPEEGSSLFPHLHKLLLHVAVASLKGRQVVDLNRQMATQAFQCLQASLVMSDSLDVLENERRDMQDQVHAQSKELRDSKDARATLEGERAASDELLSHTRQSLKDKEAQLEALRAEYQVYKNQTDHGFDDVVTYHGWAGRVQCMEEFKIPGAAEERATFEEYYRGMSI